MIKNGEFLEEYNEVCNKVSNFIKKWFDNEPIYSDKYLKTKSLMKKKLSYETQIFIMAVGQIMVLNTYAYW